jgi:hypothetical protein
MFIIILAIAIDKLLIMIATAPSYCNDPTGKSLSDMERNSNKRHPPDPTSECLPPHFEFEFDLFVLPLQQFWPCELARGACAIGTGAPIRARGGQHLCSVPETARHLTPAHERAHLPTDAYEHVDGTDATGEHVSADADVNQHADARPSPPIPRAPPLRAWDAGAT